MSILYFLQITFFIFSTTEILSLMDFKKYQTEKISKLEDKVNEMQEMVEIFAQYVEKK